MRVPVLNCHEFCQHCVSYSTLRGKKNYIWSFLMSCCLAFSNDQRKYLHSLLFFNASVFLQKP